MEIKELAIFSLPQLGQFKLRQRLMIVFLVTLKFKTKYQFNYESFA